MEAGDQLKLALACASLLRLPSAMNANSLLMRSHIEELPACESTRQAKACSGQQVSMHCSRGHGGGRRAAGGRSGGDGGGGHTGEVLPGGTRAGGR